ncbi:glycine cleavage system protein GcvH [Pseudaquidulcibacter saccharophilus]|uniref:glycine cleavage system protein GcvH n=1 Tax=Pseudaquidulcibacter saccharophilus TaxID=2831900 RepID=UPI001EFF1534|nr:glycine cleavage system protein GcvH [Pseudaquidulcibacter saccharophilus]
MTVKFTQEHEWIKIEGDVASFGITAYAAEQLGDVVYVELPEVGKTIKTGDAVAVVESVKAASDVYAPVSGEVVEANEELSASPEKVSEDAEGEGWFAKIKLSDASELDGLMDVDAYKAFLESL